MKKIPAPKRVKTKETHSEIYEAGSEKKWQEIVLCPRSKPHEIEDSKNCLTWDISDFSLNFFDIFVILGCRTAYVGSLQTPITNLRYETIQKNENE